MNMQIEFVSICSIYGPLRNRILARDARAGNTFAIFINFHDIDMNMQIEFVGICSVFGPLRNCILARDLCTFITQGPSCKASYAQEPCIFI